MLFTTSFADADDFCLTPVPGQTAPLPAQTDCATESLLCDLFYEAAVLSQRPLQARRRTFYDPWLRVTESRPPHLSSLDCGPVFVDPCGSAVHEGERRWLRTGALELAA